MAKKASDKKTGKQDLHTDIQKIEDGYVFRTQLMEAISRRGKQSSEPREILEIIEKYEEPDIYRELIFCLTNHAFDVNEAKDLWFHIISHKQALAEKLERDPGLKVATLDFLENFRKRLKNLKLIESQKIQNIAQSSLKDQLTNLYNKKTFEKRLESEMRRTRRYKRRMSLLLFDIDNFKILNDSYGHPAGDMVLSNLGHLVLENLRESDAAFRFGGEEFAVILVESSKKNAAKYAERFRRLVERTSFDKLSITISVGCGQLKNRVDTPESFVNRVDKALYKAKADGRNRVCVA